MESTPPFSMGQQKVQLPGPAGALEALLSPVPDGITPKRAVLLCHPHPLYGGTMHNKVLYRIARRLPVEADALALRFNFRGVGGSEGSYDEGKGEIQDVRAGLDWLAERVPQARLALVGYSFGAVVGLHAAALDGRPRTLVGLGVPLSMAMDFSQLAEIRVPLLLVQGEKDEFADEEAVRRFAEGLPRPPALHFVPGAGHLFQGVEDAAVDAVVRFLSEN
ncbi:MAG TPA: alpha/beta fold hydrolase [Candidatus Krumholzibacteria bacterium]|nr:alpha/beta fold hydrolase [Candidatus Krumholzibacteria bacterium]